MKLTIITRPNSMTLENTKQTEANGNLRVMDWDKHRNVAEFNLLMDSNTALLITRLIMFKQQI